MFVDGTSIVSPETGVEAVSGDVVSGDDVTGASVTGAAVSPDVVSDAVVSDGSMSCVSDIGSFCAVDVWSSVDGTLSFLY